MDKPEALRLADDLDHGVGTIDRVRHEAAAELRRLHEAHDWQYRMAGERLRRVEKLEAQRDALLEALKWIADHDLVDTDLMIAGHMAHGFIGRARSAVSAFEGDKT